MTSRGINPILVSLVLIFAAEACNRPKGYSRSEHGFYYHLLELGNSDRKAEVGSHVAARIAYYTRDDSLLYSRRITLNLRSGAGAGNIDHMLLLMHEGDSASFILDADEYFMTSANQPAPAHLSGRQFKVGIRLEQVRSSEEYQKEKEAFMAWASNLAEYEQKILEDYLENRLPEADAMQEGYFKLIREEGSGRTVAQGDTVRLHYKGRFLNGRFVDSSYPLGEAFTLVYGQEDQLIEGLDRVVGTMREGEVALAILPSKMAYGAGGSSTGIVPPFTPMIYELTILEIKPAENTD